VLTLLLALLACSPDKDDTARDTGNDTGSDSGDDSGNVDTATCTDVDGDLDQLTAPGCAGAGGVCVGSMDQCGEGTHEGSFDSECTFDDGAGFCCVPPEPAASGDSCAASGGVCAPIAGCGFAHGWYTPNDAECGAAYGVGTVCCAPTDACEGWGTTTCCSDDGATAFVPSCDRGEATCTIDATSLTCDQDCPAFE